MTDLNHVVVIGNLVRDIGSDERDFGYAPNGQARANLTIAVNRSKKSGDEWIDEANFFDVTVWGKTAENLKPYFVKGQKICVDGYLKQDRWEKDGQKNSKISIVANSVYLAGPKKGGENIQGVQNNQSTQNNPRFEPMDNNSGSGFAEDIPF